MNLRPSLLPWLGCLAATLAWSNHAGAQNVSTDPVGAITITLKGGSDTHVSLPFQRPVALETQVASISGNIITVSATANITGNQFVYSSPSQTNTYYLQFTSGNNDGQYYTVTANDNATITLNPNGDGNLDTNVNTGDTFRVIPYWTLNTLFPGGQSLYTTSTLVPQSSILLPSDTTAGINIASSSVYYYYTGSSFGGPGWHKTGDSGHLYPDVVLPPDSYFIVRHPDSAADTQLVLVGNVPMSAQSVIVNNLAPNMQQDNAVSLPVPVSVTLADSGLYPNVISGSPNLVPTDTLLVFDPTQVAQNKSASSVYYYYTGSSFGGPGWRKTNNASVIRDTDLLTPGLGFIIRRAARDTVGTVVWTYTPFYVSP